MKPQDLIISALAASLAEPQLSKNAVRRIQHTHENPITLRTRFDVGRFLDRSKYNGNGSKK
jgi:hypothetical protein